MEPGGRGLARRRVEPVLVGGASWERRVWWAGRKGLMGRGPLGRRGLLGRA